MDLSFFVYYFTFKFVLCLFGCCGVTLVVYLCLGRLVAVGVLRWVVYFVLFT